jgi:hypothetical protein
MIFFEMEINMKLSNTVITLSLIATAAVSQADPIELNKADSRIHSKYGYSWQTVEVEALVEDLAFDKNVILHYKNSEGNWEDAALSYKGETGSGKEVWSYYFTQTITGPYAVDEPLNLEFALNYQVNNNEYWDNNNTQNYYLEAGSGEYTPKAIVVDSAYARAPYDYDYNGNTGTVGGSLSVGVIVPNWGYSKNIEVHYTYDNWATTYIGNAQFQPSKFEGYSWVRYPNNNNMEVWSFYTGGEEAQNKLAEYVQYAVKYSVNGATYWDNNDGANYTLRIQK